MKTATIIYRWTAKTSSRCLGRYYTASTLLEAIKAGKEFVAREFSTGRVPYLLKLPWTEEKPGTLIANTDATVIPRCAGQRKFSIDTPFPGWKSYLAGE